MTSFAVGERMKIYVYPYLLLMMIVCIILLFSAQAFALPFNDDMVHDQPKTGDVMRKLPEGSIPTHAKLPLLSNMQDAEALSNPKRGDKNSWKNGKRLFAINCTPCHGEYDKTGRHTKSRVAEFWPVPPPVLSDPQYKDRSEGNLFATIHFGRGIMPRYGWKLSEEEHWDIVNYVRRLQGY